MVDEESLKSYLARMRREREERRKALSERFKRELRDKAHRRAPLDIESPRFPADSMEWAFAMVLIVAFSTGLAHAAQTPVFEAPRAAGVVDVSPAAIALALPFEPLGAVPAVGSLSVRSSTGVVAGAQTAPSKSTATIEKNMTDVMRGARIVQEIITGNLEDVARGALAVAAVARFLPETYTESAAVFADATFGTAARAYVAAVYLWGDGMHEGYALTGESALAGAEAALELLAASANPGELTAAIAVANACSRNIAPPLGLC